MARSAPEAFDGVEEAPPRRGLARLADIDDGAILRVAFFALLAGTAGVLWLDYGELTGLEPASLFAPQTPILPAFETEGPESPDGPSVTTDPETLRAPAQIALTAGGLLTVIGTIDPGAAERFAAEVEARGEYVEAVVLDSPGGSVVDALAMGRLIREKGFITRVAAGSLCASSCPLVLAGGAEREASPEAAIGVHQIYAAEAPDPATDSLRSSRRAMADAQATTARISRYLDDMGIAPTLWVHALETPPDRLYYFSPEELVDLKLVTRLDQRFAGLPSR
ncbi:hypothetical protein SAMN02983003_2500 [Devosia enhydra]|uniref:Uncharacterized protein n=1 Tax=Devosia enhydra TaxID=665118 RepID=A0A1K2I0N1_9HYPH|nr:hypothetical protein [Devosia enhydra]SFZ85306.1 hypothetical protein SAMN02983003_2500 [Devosia enhydra]